MSGASTGGTLPLGGGDTSPREWPRSQLFGLLAGMYLCRPTRDAIEGWRSLVGARPPGPLEELGAVLGELDLSERSLEDLLWEYTRLFLGPYRLPAPPWESVYTSPKRLLMQEAYDSVVDAYREAGVEVADKTVLADHVGAELNFLSVLHGRAEAGGDMGAVELAKRFHVTHVLAWMPSFAADLERAAEHDLYRSLARATRGVIVPRGGS